MIFDAISSASHAAFTWTLTTSLAATVLVALIVLVQILFRKVLPARWRYALWLCVVARVMFPTAPTSSFSIFNGAKLFVTAPSPLTPAPISLPTLENPAGKFPATASTDLINSDATQKEPLVGSGSLSLLEVASYLWIVGAAGYLLLIVIHHRKLAAWLNCQQPLNDPGLLALMEQTKTLLRVRRDLQVFESNCLRAPSLFGFFKPRLLLPRTLAHSLNVGELRLIILHELIHLKRRDVLLNWVIIVVQAIHWFNPFVWLAMRRLRSERELVCDGAVIAYLADEERRAYGATLIKLVDNFSNASLTPSLVPMINRKKEMHRRITMIANFKPTARLVTIASAILVLTVVCLTFTTATEKAPPAAAPANDKAPLDPMLKTRKGSSDRLDALQKMIEEQRQLIRHKQADLDSRTSDVAALEREALLKYKTLRADVQADYSQVNAMYSYLTNLNRSELKKAIATASPDSQLSTLLDQRSTAEQKLALLSDNYGNDHPEVKSARRLLEVISMQLNDRLDGVLAGLKGKAFALKARMRHIDDEIEKAKEIDDKATLVQKAHLQGKRELDSMQQALERMQARLLEEKINAALGQ